MLEDLRLDVREHNLARAALHKVAFQCGSEEGRLKGRKIFVNVKLGLLWSHNDVCHFREVLELLSVIGVNISHCTSLASVRARVPETELLRPLLG